MIENGYPFEQALVKTSGHPIVHPLVDQGEFASRFLALVVGNGVEVDATRDGYALFVGPIPHIGWSIRRNASHQLASDIEDSNGRVRREPFKGNPAAVAVLSPGVRVDFHSSQIGGRHDGLTNA